MKKLLLILVAVTMLVACGKKSSTESQSTTPQPSAVADTTATEQVAPVEESVPALTQAICSHLALCVPDHEMRDDAREYISEDYQAAWDNLRAMPDIEEYMGNMPNYEWIYYFVTGNGECDHLQAHIEEIAQTDTTATVCVTYTCEEGDDDGELHRMRLAYYNHKWMLTDFDDTKFQMQAWVEDETNRFIGDDEWMAEFAGDTAAMNRYKRDMYEFIYNKEN